MALGPTVANLFADINHGKLVTDANRLPCRPRTFSSFSFPQRMPYWYGAEMDSCFEVQDGAADFSVGSEGAHLRPAGKQSCFAHGAWSPPLTTARLLEWRFEDAYGVRGMERWELEPVAEWPAGAPAPWCDLPTSTNCPDASAALFDWLLTRHAVARRNREYLERLARLAERRRR